MKGFWGSVVSKTMDAETRGALFGELSRYLTDGTLTLPRRGDLQPRRCPRGRSRERLAPRGQGAAAPVS
ncbi:hypothetical protein HR12_34710 [Microbacterium sp. SUBG005]|nr:hypothetical protein HR12_34710 [Microbacterium sp. SUBG005]